MARPCSQKELQVFKFLSLATAAVEVPPRGTPVVATVIVAPAATTSLLGTWASFSAQARATSARPAKHSFKCLPENIRLSLCAADGGGGRAYKPGHALHEAGYGRFAFVETSIAPKVTTPRTLARALSPVASHLENNLSVRASDLMQHSE